MCFSLLIDGNYRLLKVVDYMLGEYIITGEKKEAEIAPNTLVLLSAIFFYQFCCNFMQDICRTM